MPEVKGRNRTITLSCDDCDTEGAYTLYVAEAATFEEFDNVWDDAMEATREYLRGQGWTIVDGTRMCPTCTASADAGVPRPPEEEGFGIRFVGLRCDTCRATVEGDFRADTQAEAFTAVREHAKTLGWSITDAGDRCPTCKPDVP